MTESNAAVLPGAQAKDIYRNLLLEIPGGQDSQTALKNNSILAWQACMSKIYSYHKYNKT